MANPSFIIPIASLCLLLMVSGCVQNDGIVCNKPYIRVADSCCLDMDDNAVCDRDEPSSTTFTPTTTIMPGCHFYYWFDNMHRECNYTQFCGAYMYQGLMTFQTEDECEDSLSATTTSTTTRTTSTTATTTTTTTTSTTTTTQKVLPVTEGAFEIHIINSEEFQELVDDYGRRNIQIFVDALSYSDAKEEIESLDDDNNIDCLDCFNFSRGRVWVSEFGNKDYRMGLCLIDMETGTGAMYISDNDDDITCRCDTI